jgi:plastocyanin
MMRRRLAASVVLSALALVALGACGSSSGGGGASKVTKTASAGAITVGAFDIRFDVNVIKTTAGPFTVTLVNHGAIEHTFKLEGTSMLIKAKAGKSASGTVTLKKGTYDFECTIPGHASQGMKGTVDVS